jgi:hypothetical protein
VSQGGVTPGVTPSSKPMATVKATPAATDTPTETRIQTARPPGKHVASLTGTAVDSVQRTESGSRSTIAGASA